jgi:beta-barrel assembly-enhancing protease
MIAFDAFYADGRTAEQKPVGAILSGGGIEIRDAGGATLAEWPYAEIELVEEVFPGQPVRLRARQGGNARLVVRDPAFYDALAQHLPRLGGDMRRSRSLGRAAAWIAAVAAALFGAYIALPLLAEPIAAIVPLAWEERLGKGVRDTAVGVFTGGKARYCEGAEGQRAIERLVKRLAETTPSRYRFDIQVVDDKTVNAFAAPGGFIVVFRGLVDKAEGPEELAGVLAHEMGHVIERHGMENLVRALGAGTILAAVLGDASTLGATLAEYGSTLASLSYGRDAEREADAVGVAMLNKAGIRGTGLVAFFRRLAKLSGESGGGGVGRYLSTHPPSDERAATIAQRSTGAGEALTAAEWAAVKSMCGK